MKSIIQFIVILLIGVIVVLVTTWLVNLIKEPTIIEKPIEKVVLVKSPECLLGYDEYIALKEKGQLVSIVNNLSTYASAGKFINDKKIILKRTGSGKIACGYLYIRGHVDGRKLDSKYESIYINPQGFGGHILRTKSLLISNQITGTTEVLMPLNAITYLPTVPYNPDAQNFRISDWVNLLNASDQLEFNVALSAQDKEGVIDEINMAYKCWDSEQGKETTDCQLGVD
jgi:hypothetical protein